MRHLRRVPSNLREAGHGHFCASALPSFVHCASVYRSTRASFSLQGTQGFHALAFDRIEHTHTHTRTLALHICETLAYKRWIAYVELWNT